MCVFERVREKLAISIAMKKQAGCEIEAIGMNYIIYPKKRYSNPFKTMFNRDNPQQQQQQQQQDQEVFTGAAPGGGTDHKPAESRRGMHVLKDINCVAKPWEILAVVGPSGAGKSTLLEILAGRLTPQMSSIYVNRKPIEKAHFKKISGYVAQKDLLFPLLTVEETLMFSAKLRLSHIPPSHLESRVKSLIQELGLGHVAKARVGDDRFRGISGGERRRVSIGVDVIHDPRVLILDEPTSGLDSSSALQIIDMLKIMAETRGRTIILSIHQPGFRIVKLFNSVLLLANGSVLHHGTVDQLQMQLRETGIQLPLHVNIVDFAIDSIETLQLASDQEQVLPQIAPAAAAPQHSKNMRLGEGDHHIHQASAGTNKTSTGKKLTLQQLFQQSKQVVDHEAEEYCIDDHHDLLNIPYCGGGYANSRLRETVILTHRFSKNIYRTKELFACRTIQMLIVGLVLGSIFYNLKDDLVGSQERVGLFAFILTFLLSCTTEALPIFLQEREILMKETSCGSYRVSSYVIANGLVFLPFLLILALLFSLPLYWLVGLNPSIAAFMYFLLLIWLIFYTANSVVVCFSALVPNFIVGNSVISGVMGSFFLFSGYFISKNGMPKFWVFMHYISLFKYPFEGFLINEFSGWGAGSKCLDYMFGACVVTGEDILKEEGFGEESRWRNVVIMVCFILFYRFMSYIILRCRCSQRS